MTTFFDDAYGTTPVPPGVNGVCPYIGGDTPHVWTAADLERNRAARFRLPIFVRSDPQNASYIADANAAVAWLNANGAPKGISVVLDLEMAISPGYVSAFGHVLNMDGYKVLPYGSESTLFQNPKLDGYFVANPTGVDHMVAGCVVTQWFFGQSYDLDDVLASVPVWDTAPHLPVPTPAPTVHVPAPSPPTGGSEDTTMAIVSAPGRVDLLVIGTDKGVYHATAPTLGDLVSAKWARVGPTNSAGLAVSAVWATDFSALLVAVHGTDNRPYLIEMSAAGAWGSFARMDAGVLLAVP